MSHLLKSLAVAAALALPAAASAQSINERQATIDARIDQGVRSGQLTRPEARRLRASFDAIRLRERDYRRSGGRFTQSERRDIEARLDALSARVRAQKRDRDRR